MRYMELYKGEIVFGFTCTAESPHLRSPWGYRLRLRQTGCARHRGGATDRPRRALPFESRGRKATKCGIEAQMSSAQAR